MIGTHTVKLVNSKAKQDALCADIIADLPDHFVTSQTTNITKKYYACPKNAADMRTWREQSALVNGGELEPEHYIPNIQDPREIKQLLIPQYKWQLNNYHSVTPVESLGLLREVWLRSKALKTYVHHHPLEVTPAAFSNHSELLLDQAGHVALLKRGVKVTQYEGDECSNVLQMVFDVQKMNVASGFLAYGHPAITAIGGLVHTLERQTEQAIKFAVGFKSLSFDGLMRESNYKRGTIKSQLTKPMVINELTASGEIVLLFKAADLTKLASELKRITRVSGGRVFNPKITEIWNEPPEIASYLRSAIGEVKIDPSNPDIEDALAHAIFMYQNNRNAYSLNHTGYAYLEEPRHRKYSRDEQYLHAWVEPIYSLVKQGVFSEKCWWSRQNKNGYMAWS